MDDVKDNPTLKDRKETTKYPADRTESMIGSDSVQEHSGALDDYWKNFAEKALENRIFIRRVADLEGRGLTEEDRRIDSINKYLVKYAMSRVTDPKVITGDLKWEELANEFVRHDNIVKSIESKKQNGSSSKWSLIKKAEAAEMPQDGVQKDSAVNAIDSKKESDSDFDVCKCALPDDRDFYCQKCGKMSKWLAPHRDEEFEQMLKRGSN